MSEQSELLRLFCFIMIPGDDSLKNDAVAGTKRAIGDEERDI